jgi:hypothetical protein
MGKNRVASRPSTLCSLLKAMLDQELSLCVLRYGSLRRNIAVDNNN